MSIEKAQQVRAAIDAGFWITKAHGRWRVVRGHGSDIAFVGPCYGTKAAALLAMVKAAEGAK